MNKTSITGEAGMLWNYPDLNIPKPCNECTIVEQWAGLEFADGRNANIDSGMWLHHMVHLAIGTGRWDPTCYGKPSLPHIDVNSSPSGSERYFSSGNERTKIQLDLLGPGATKWGYHLKSSDKYGFIVDLMNMNAEDKTVYLTMTYDFLEGPLPSGWDDVKVVWFDANQCGTSEVRPPKQNGQFTISSYKWTPNFTGKILGVGGHLHDGGVALDIKYGSGQTLCSSKAKYSETAEYRQGGMAGMGHGSSGGGHSHSGSDHISSMSTCYLGVADLPVKTLSKDQSWYIEGKYDYNQFAGMKDPSGWQSEVMAIALMYVAVTPGVTSSSWFKHKI
jgi:hypothetical protein